MNYYGVTRSTDHLAHYGVMGMRWGVRKAITSGNQAALDRHYRRAARKLAKLQNIGNNPYKSAAKAAAYGAAAAGTGALAIGGTGLAAKGIRYGAAGIRTIGKGLEARGINTKNKYGTLLSKRPLAKLENAAKGIEEWGGKTTTINLHKHVVDPKTGLLVKQGVLGENGQGIKIGNNKIFRAGAALATAGLAAKAYQHGRRAKRADEYRDKAERWKEEMDRNFAGTEYEGHYEKVRRKAQRNRRRYNY